MLVRFTLPIAQCHKESCVYPRAKFILLIMLLIATAVFIPACARPRPGPTKPDYYPLTKGNRWEFLVVTGGKPPVIAVCSVVDFDLHHGKVVARLEMKYPDHFGIFEELCVGGKGMYRCSFPGAKLPRPITILRYPVQAREHWSEVTRLGGEETEIFTRILGTAEEVQVPAGRFDAVTVETILQTPTQHAKTTSWYVDTVGLVKQLVTADGQTTTMELLRFDRAQ